MKKYSIIIIAIIAALLVSCNIDATDGIYSEAADSTESTAVTIRSYLGQDNTGRYYYLTDEGIYIIGREEALFSSTEGKIIRAASLLSDGSLLILRQNSDLEKGAQISYHKYDNGVYADAILIEGKYNNLLTNGLFYNSEGIYCYSIDEAERKSLLGDNMAIKDIKGLANGAYSLFEVEDPSGAYKFYVFTSDGYGNVTKTIDGIDAADLTNPTYCGGFQFVGAVDYDYVVLYRQPSSSKLKVYTMDDVEGVSEEPVVTIDFSNNDAPVFLYAIDDCMYIKDTNSFKKISTYDYKTEQITTGFATDIRTAEITNILPAKDNEGNVRAGVFIAGTASSMLYEIDMNLDKSTQIK